MLEILNSIDGFIWGPPLMILLIGTGILMSVRLGLLQVMKLPKALQLIFTARSKGEGDVSSFQALCTALAATVGTGNIVGVATAIKLGGPGALLWMWLAAFFGMATKYSEGVLAVKYRTYDENGNASGGPMYYIEQGLGKKFKPLAVMFSIFGVMTACLGSGTFTQVNAITSIVNVSFGVSEYVVAAILTVLVAVVIIGGLQSIANVASKIVPFMAAVYVIATVSVLVFYADALPAAIKLVIDGAFNGTAAAGGFAGAGIMLAMRSGIARGIYSNESGLGSAPIVAAAAKTKWPAEQGLVSMTGTFIDTIIICTMTGLSIVISGGWQPDLGLEGASITMYAFENCLPFPAAVGGFILMMSLVFFAFTTILGWNYYAERCMEYLSNGSNLAVKIYRWIYIAAVFVGPYLTVSAVWTIADIFNGLMAIPNIVALLALSGVIARTTREYFDRQKKKA